MVKANAISSSLRPTLLLGCLVCILVHGSLTSDPKESEQHHEQPLSAGVEKPLSNEKGTKVLSLAESIWKSQKRFRDKRANTMQQYWKEAFKEIKSLTLDSKSTPSSTATGNANPLNQWKLLLDEAVTPVESKQDADLTNGEGASPWMQSERPRFEGFASWERQLQQWADDVSDYIEKSQVEEGAYPFSTYGRPTVQKDTDESTQLRHATDPEEILQEDETVEQPESTSVVSMVIHSGSETDAQKQLPIPAPAKPGEPVLPHTDISDKSKRILIVTTASLPWMTGTAVNALLRAAYLVNGRAEAGGSVTLMLPWLERRSDQERVYGANRLFDTQVEQEEYIRTWLRETADMQRASEDLKISWYTGWQERAENSVYSMGDITALIPDDEVDICILEEPEHLNWYRAPGESWTGKFKHVVGIIHTNYFAYAQEQPAALIRAPAMRLLCSWMCRAHCHRVIKLSGTLGQFAQDKELVENVHGVRGTFLQIGEQLRQKLRLPNGDTDLVFSPEAEPSVYFIGKMLWSKGIGSLIELLKYAEESAGLKLKVDMYGGGPDKDAADARASKLGLDMPFHGPVDHSELAFTHKIFINPSTSEVLCTTVAEALAMGKFVVLPSHPSNDFFEQFPNCLAYASKEEFVGNLYYALTHSPEPLSKEYAYALSWEAATERLEAAGCISVAEAEGMAAALSSTTAGVEIDLPPLIDSEKRRKQIAMTFQKSRERYRQFRSRLSQDLQKSKVLPKDLQRLLVSELDKRLDLDIETILESPKLRLQLAPAELDKQLLEFYNKVSQSPSGDVLRVIGGGSNVGMQNLYMKRQAQKVRRRASRNGLTPDQPFPLPAFAEAYDTDENQRTASQWVKLALRRNLPAKNTSFTTNSQETSLQSKNQDSTKMMMRCHSHDQHLAGMKVPVISKPTCSMPRRLISSSPLI